MSIDARARRVIAAIVGAGLIALATIGPVSAGASKTVQIVSHMTFVDGDFNVGDFHATGAAVDGGLICPSGTVVDTRIQFGGYQSGRGVQIPVRKHFTCADGSGTFEIKIQVHLDFATNTETFSWVVLSGTGDYANLTGAGSGTTVTDGSDPQTGNINTYVGILVG
jgi:hypothetical protein